MDAPRHGPRLAVSGRSSRAKGVSVSLSAIQSPASEPARPARATRPTAAAEPFRLPEPRIEAAPQRPDSPRPIAERPTIERRAANRPMADHPAHDRSALDRRSSDRIAVPEEPKPDRDATHATKRAEYADEAAAPAEVGADATRPAATAASDTPIFETPAAALQGDKPAAPSDMSAVLSIFTPQLSAVTPEANAGEVMVEGGAAAESSEPPAAPSLLTAPSPAGPAAATAAAPAPKGALSVVAAAALTAGQEQVGQPVQGAGSAMLDEAVVSGSPAASAEAEGEGRDAEKSDAGASPAVPPGLAVAREQAAASSVAAAGLAPPFMRESSGSTESAVQAVPPGLGKRAALGAVDPNSPANGGEQAAGPGADAGAPGQPSGDALRPEALQGREVQPRLDAAAPPLPQQARAPDAPAPPPAPAVPPELPRAVPPAAVPVEIGLRALQGLREFQIRLDPAELGKVEVRLEIGEDKSVTARVVVDRVETLQLLQRDARTLERAFEQAGLKTTEGGVDITLRDPGQQARDGRGGHDHMQGGPHGRGAREGGEAEAAPIQPLFRRTVHRGALDLSI